MKNIAGFRNRMRRVFTWYFTTKLVLATIIIAVSAAITVTPTTLQAELGSAYQVTNNLTVADKGFSKASAGTTATGSCPTGNVTFSGVAGTANNAITAGEIVYDLQVNATSSTPIVSCFTVTLTLSIGGSQTSKSLTVASGASIASGETIDCKLDIGTTTIPASPFSFKVTVG